MRSAASWEATVPTAPERAQLIHQSQWVLLSVGLGGFSPVTSFQPTFNSL